MFHPTHPSTANDIPVKFVISRKSGRNAPNAFGSTESSMTNSRKTALITGVTGQDGAYLSEFLLKKGYEVHGIKRRSSLFNTDRIDHLYQDPQTKDRTFVLHYGDMTDSLNLTRIVQEVQPDEIYNLAAMSHVQVSFDTPEYGPTPTVSAPCGCLSRCVCWA